MFAAGLLLGFSMFAQPEPVPEVDSAFQNAISVLEQLGQLSPQARHYFEILSTFNDAIHARREQLGRERRKKSDRYVSQIFTADFQDPSISQPEPAAAYTTPSSGGGGVAVSGEGTGSANGNVNLDPLLGGVGVDLDGYDLGMGYPQQEQGQADDWTDMPLLSDNLYIDWESLWPVLDGGAV